MNGIAGNLARMPDDIAAAHAALHHANCGITVADTRKDDLPLVFVNDTLCRMTGHSREELLGRNGRIFQGNETQADYIERMRRAIRDGRNCTVTLHNYRKDGSVWENRLTLEPIHDSDGVLTHYIGIHVDITRERELHHVECRAEHLLETTDEGVIITDTRKRIQQVNRAFTEITGYSEEEVRGKTHALLSSGYLDRTFYQKLWQSVARNGHWRGELWNRRKSGEPYAESLSMRAVHDREGRLINYIGTFADITRLKNSEAEMERLIHYDPLTELPNRLLLISRIEHAAEQHQDDETGIGILFCNLDRFKIINESLGHRAGDEVLLKMKSRLRACLRAEDTLARPGGDDFVAMVESVADHRDLARLAQALIESASEPMQLSSGQEVVVGLSVGISLSPGDGTDAGTLIKNADTAMHVAKKHGRSTYRFYTAGLTRAARQRLALEGKLRRAVEEGAFTVHFQPLMCLDTGRITGAEALARWPHPEDGLIPPDRFIPLAEETGLIIDIGDTVLRAACQAATEWHTSGLGDLSVAVNLSGRQFRHGDLGDRIAAILDETKFPHARLELEITETVLMEESDHSLNLLRDLKALGVRLAIDDFGTGYSSLAYLKQFSVDKLKIDRAFISDLPGDADSAQIARTIISMGRHLEMEVLAEGAETEAQCAFLRDHGCNSLQSYMVSPPVPADEFLAFVQSRRETAPHVRSFR